VLRVPAVYATAAALLCRAFNIEVPSALFHSVVVTKDAAIPAMLILLGLQLSHSARVQRWTFVSTGVLLKLLVGPLIGIALVLIFQLESLTTIAFLLQVSMPTAVITLILAKEYQLDETLTLNIITVSTLLSPFTLSLLILVLKQTLIG
jgi:predicted permease